MKGAAFLLTLLAASPAFPHRLDEYLQLSVLSVERGRIRVTLDLTPGVSVFKPVMATMDTNRDGVLSPAEQRAYAARVAGDLSLRVDGKPRLLRVGSVRFPTVDAMRKGSGEIRLKLEAAVPIRPGPHALAFENRHQRPIAAYLVECLAPFDPSFEVVAQSRSREQERYEVRYLQAATLKG